MKKTMICLVALFVVLGLYATVYAQAGGNQAGGVAPTGKICKPGAIPYLSGGQSQLFEAESHFEAQCTCNQVAEHYKQYVCYATPSSAMATGQAPSTLSPAVPLWYCQCSKTKTW